MIVLKPEHIFINICAEHLVNFRHFVELFCAGTFTFIFMVLGYYLSLNSLT